jgi:hypothetical protein
LRKVAKHFLGLDVHTRVSSTDNKLTVAQNPLFQGVKVRSELTIWLPVKELHFAECEPNDDQKHRHENLHDKALTVALVNEESLQEEGGEMLEERFQGRDLVGGVRNGELILLGLLEHAELLINLGFFHGSRLCFNSKVFGIFIAMAN